MFKLFMSRNNNQENQEGGNQEIRLDSQQGGNNVNNQ